MTRADDMHSPGGLQLLTAAHLGRIPPTDITFLCGAGISVPRPSRLPTVFVFIDAILDHCGATSAMTEAVAAERSRGDRPPPRFESLVEDIVHLGADAGLLGSVFETSQPNAIHRALGDHVRRGAAVVTTNFDNAIEHALGEPMSRVVFDGHDLDFRPPLQSVVVKPHGSNRLGADDTPSLVGSLGALGRTARGFARFPQWRTYLRALFEKPLVIVAGYSASDDFDIVPVLLESDVKHIWWIDYDPFITLPERASGAQTRGGVRRVCDKHDVEYFRGSFEHLASELRGDGASAPLAMPATSPPDRLGEWLDVAFPSDADRQALLSLSSTVGSEAWNSRDLKSRPH